MYKSKIGLRPGRFIFNWNEVLKNSEEFMRKTMDSIVFILKVL